MTHEHSPPRASRPCGGWPSIIDAAAIAAGVTALTEPRVLGDTVYWLETRPAEGGRTTLVRQDREGSLRELTPAPWDVRSRVHEYGGGAYLPTGLGTFFVGAVDQNVYRIDTSDAALDIAPLTTGGDEVRYADFCLDASRAALIAVSERHAGDGVHNALEVLDLGRPGAAPRTLHHGRDFYAAPRLSPDGRRLAFLTWDHPNMPWDGTELRLLDLDPDGRPLAETLVAGGAAESVLQPVWMADGALVFVSDANGFWNLYRFDDQGTVCVLEDRAEYAEAPWALAQSSFTPLDARYLAAVRREEQRSELMLVDTAQGFASPLECRWQEIRGLTCQDRALIFLGGRADEATALVRMPLASAAPEMLARAALPDLPRAWIAPPEPLRFPTRDGTGAYAYYYPPTNPDVDPATGAPPLLVMTHGGPTSRAAAALDLRVQYFTSRGFAVVDVDYRGSSGYGRDYRRALDGRWGIVDVLDCEDAVAHLVARGLADPGRVAIRGGSAGGFTTLSALTRSRTFGAGASYYGIGDLTALAAETHKFESRYLYTLVGDATALEQRSPIRHVDGLRCPVIFFQGSDDRVVPPGQSREMVAALERQRLPVAYLEFPGERHGFRRAENIQRALTCEYAFYCRVFGIDADDPAPELEIHNL